MQANPALGNTSPAESAGADGTQEHDATSTPKYITMPQYKIMPLPVTKPMEWALTTPPNPFRFTESCVTKAVQSAVIGGSMGVVLGFLIGSYSSIAPPVTLPGVPDPPKIPLRYQMRESWMTTARQCRSMGKNFGSMVFLISGIECVIDKARANSEIKNRLMAGCITGAALAAPAGPGAACFGCAGFAAFTGAFEVLME